MGVRPARADDDLALYRCRVPGPRTSLQVSFKPDASIADLATYLMSITCKNVVFASDVPRRATKVTIMSPGALRPKQAVKLVVDAIEATGLVVVQKADTITIKLGPGSPRGCPDLAATAPADASEPTAILPPPVPGEVTEAELDAGIKTIDATTREVARSVLDAILAHPMAVAKQARVVPAITHGEVTGLKLYALRTRSILARAGLHNGDEVTAVNGMALTSMDRSLEIYGAVRSATSITVVVRRRGQLLTLVFTLT